MLQTCPFGFEYAEANLKLEKVDLSYIWRVRFASSKNTEVYPKML